MLLGGSVSLISRDASALLCAPEGGSEDLCGGRSSILVALSRSSTSRSRAVVSTGLAPPKMLLEAEGLPMSSEGAERGLRFSLGRSAGPRSESAGGRSSERGPSRLSYRGASREPYRSSRPETGKTGVSCDENYNEL